MITPSFSLTATERVLPRVTFDFITSLLDSRITFERIGATATRVNNLGNVEIVSANTPRFDFNPISLICKGLLIEELRENEVPYSDDFRNTVDAGEVRPWNYLNITVSSNIANSPDGTQNADKVEETSATGEHAIFHDNFAASSVNLTVTVFAKASERSKINLAISNFATGDARCTYDLSTGTAGAATSNTSDYTSPIGKITAFKDDWYRCELTVVKGSVNTNNFVVINLNNGSTTNYTGTTGSGLFLYGAQLEVGQFATSYIPTVGATVTRNEDLATITGVNFSSWFNSSEGGTVIQTLPNTILGTRPAIQFDDNTANNSIVLRGVAADTQLHVVDGGSAQATLDAGTIVEDTVYRLGGAWKSSSFAAAVNGNAADSQSSGSYPTTTQARLGSDGTNYLNGCLQNIQYWPQRIINTEVQAFSK